VGRVPFDRAVVEALADGRPPTESPHSPGGAAFREACERILERLKSRAVTSGC